MLHCTHCISRLSNPNSIFHMNIYSYTRGGGGGGGGGETCAFMTVMIGIL